MDILTDNECHRAAEQGVQALNEVNGDRGRRRCLLQAAGIHITEDGTRLENNEGWKGASQFAPLPNIVSPHMACL